jgi:hypothetical protein
MLQVFYIDVTKVDRDVANVARAIHVCFKCMFQTSLKKRSEISLECKIHTGSRDLPRD